MTVSSEAKRTLVKSPPELWSEVSDAESLARHLDGVEQIRITRVEPETAVEWEADGASGSVRLQPSGFGTKVTLSLSRDLPPTEPAPVGCEPASEPASEPELVAEPEPVVEPEPELVAAPEPEPFAAPEPVAEPESERQGFFGRLFKRRRKPSASADESIGAQSEPETAPIVELEPAASVLLEPEATSEPLPVEPVEVLAATEQALAPEAEMAEQDEAMLTAMLDRLGAAHHRPFSRS